MRFLFLSLFLSIFLCLGACKIIEKEMLIRSTLASDYGDPFVKETPSRLLNVIQHDSDNERAWKALHHYSTITNAGNTLTLYRDCFNAIEEDPLLFFNRYLSGDENALFRMVDALSHDFSAFERTYIQIDQVFKQSLNQILNFINNDDLEGETYVRAYNFYRISLAQYNSWKLRYCEFQRSGTEIIEINCAPWE